MAARKQANENMCIVIYIYIYIIVSWVKSLLSQYIVYVYIIKFVAVYKETFIALYD
jgi:hypothetical protein